MASDVRICFQHCTVEPLISHVVKSHYNTNLTVGRSTHRVVEIVLVFRVVGNRGHGSRGRIGAGVDRSRRFDGHRAGPEHLKLGHRRRLLRLCLLLQVLLLLYRFGPVEHALGARRLEVQPAQCAGRAGDEIVSG